MSDTLPDGLILRDVTGAGVTLADPIAPPGTEPLLIPFAPGPQPRRAGLVGAEDHGGWIMTRINPAHSSILLTRYWGKIEQVFEARRRSEGGQPEQVREPVAIRGENGSFACCHGQSSAQGFLGIPPRNPVEVAQPVAELLQRRDFPVDPVLFLRNPGAKGAWFRRGPFHQFVSHQADADDQREAKIQEPDGRGCLPTTHAANRSSITWKRVHTFFLSLFCYDSSIEEFSAVRACPAIRPVDGSGAERGLRPDVIPVTDSHGQAQIFRAAPRAKCQGKAGNGVLQARQRIAALYLLHEPDGVAMKARFADIPFCLETGRRNSSYCFGLVNHSMEERRGLRLYAILATCLRGAAP